MNHLEKEVAPLSTFESKLIKENQNLLKKLDQQTQWITEQDQQIKQLTEQVEFLMKPELLEDFLPWAKKVQEHCKGI